MLSLTLLTVALCGIPASFAAPSSAQDGEITALEPRRATVPVYSSCTKAGTFALTFDDGPYMYGPQLIKTLDKYDATGSFFFNGNNYDCIYSQADNMKSRFAEGHFLANHAWSHAHMGKATYAQANDQVKRVEDAFIKILGVKPLWFRAPFGEYNDNVLQVLADRGYKGMVLWSEDSTDTATPQPKSSTIINLYKKFPVKTIALNHEVKDFTVKEVMPKVIPALQKRGFSLVSVPECLGMSSDPDTWYKYVKPAGKRDSTWTCDGTPAPGQF